MNLVLVKGNGMADAARFFGLRGEIMDKVQELTQILKNSTNVVFFGGAGMSTESGIPDFRSANGIYSQSLNREFTPEEMVSHSFMMAHPAEFFDFYRTRLMYMDVKPNPGHFALARLEQAGILKAIVTQNIDGLHQMAGSKRVYELHGSSFRWHCMDCGEEYPVEFVLDKGNMPIPRCTACGGIVRPDVVLYEEGLDNMVIAGAVSAISHADTLIVGGTSLIVYPAAGLIDYFRGDNLILINKTATKADALARLVIREPIGQTLAEAVKDI